MPDRRTTLCNRLIARAVNGLSEAFDVIAPFWQTPREVEWAKAAADGLADREAEEEVAEPTSHWKVGDSYCGLCGENITAVSFHACPMRAKTPTDAQIRAGLRGVEIDTSLRVPFPKTSAPTPGAESGPAEGEPPEPSAGVGTVCIVCFRPSGNCDCVERLFGPFPARSAAVESPASVPAAECSAPEFDWVTTAIPVIAGVLGDHIPVRSIGPWTVYCEHVGGELCAEFADMQDWQDHVSPIIAACLQLQTPRSTTVYDFPSGDRPRPLADFPKHQK